MQVPWTGTDRTYHRGMGLMEDAPAVPHAIPSPPDEGGRKGGEVGRLGFEPRTDRLRADCSTAELATRHWRNYHPSATPPKPATRHP